MYKSPALIKTAFTSLMLASTILALLCGSAIAVGPVFWEISKQDDVIKGDARGVSIAENGTITLTRLRTEDDGDSGGGDGGGDG